jgi:hypothetical protein
VTAAASVVTISITAEALAAIEATLADGRAADRRPDGKAGYFATLPHGVLDRLKALRAPGRESQRRDPARRIFDSPERRLSPCNRAAFSEDAKARLRSPPQTHPGPPGRSPLHFDGDLRRTSSGLAKHAPMSHLQPSSRPSSKRLARL